MSTETNAMHKRLVRLAMTTALATTALTACTGKVAPSANYSAAQAESALAKGKTSKAIEHAEAAVLAAPRDGATRTLLANAYLEAGRFQSAATTYGEAIQVGDTNPRTVISLSLAQIGIGDLTGAYVTLERYESVLDPADFGLAVALTGRADKGVEILGNALRGGQNSPKVRQNLAYAFALQGNWIAARVMAAEDVPADQVDERLAKWASMAQPGAFQVRVASLLGVTPSQDQGQPAMLALANHPGVDQLAAEIAGPEALAAELAPALAMKSELPPAGPAPAAFEAAFQAGDAALADAELAPAIDGPRFVSNAIVQDIPVSRGADFAPRVSGKPVPVRAAAAPARAPMIAGNYNIQLGSYFSMSDAQEAWKLFQKRHPELRDSERLITKARVKGKIYYRVAAAGFARESALSLCSTAKSRGAGCIAYASSTPLPGAIDNKARVAAR